MDSRMNFGKPPAASEVDKLLLFRADDKLWALVAFGLAILMTTSIQPANVESDTLNMTIKPVLTLDSAAIADCRLNSSTELNSTRIIGIERVTITNTTGVQLLALSAPGGENSSPGQGVCGVAPPTQKQELGHKSHS